MQGAKEMSAGEKVITPQRRERIREQFPISEPISEQTASDLSTSGVVSVIGIFRQLDKNDRPLGPVRRFFAVQPPLQEPDYSIDDKEQRKSENSGSLDRTSAKTWNASCQSMDNDKLNGG